MRNFILILSLLIVITIQTGGYKDISLKEFTQNNADIFSFIKNNLDEKAGEDYIFNKIESIQVQIVSGMNYKIIADYQQKDDPNQFLQQEIIVYDQPWTETRKIMSLKQEKLRVDEKKYNQQQYHGWVDLKSEQFIQKYPDILEKLLAKIIPKFELENDIQILQVNQVKEQFIDGKTFLILISLSNGQTYKGIIYENPWSKNMEVIEVMQIDNE